MSMSPFEAFDWCFSETLPARLTFSLLSSSRSSDSDLFLRRSPGSLCVGTWKLEKELPNDGLFSEYEKIRKIKHRKLVSACGGRELGSRSLLNQN